jgi:hypothetical protein
MHALSSIHNVKYLHQIENNISKIAFSHPTCGYMIISLSRPDAGFKFRWVWWHDDLENGRRLTINGERKTSGELNEIVSEFYILINSVFQMNSSVLKDCGHAFDWKKCLGAEKAKEMMNLQAAYYPHFQNYERHKITAVPQIGRDAP